MTRVISVNSADSGIDNEPKQTDMWQGSVNSGYVIAELEVVLNCHSNQQGFRATCLCLAQQ